MKLRGTGGQEIGPLLCSLAAATSGGKDASAGGCSHPKVLSHYWVNRGSHTEHGFSAFQPADLTVLWPAGRLFQTVPNRVRHLRIIGIVIVFAWVPHTTVDNQSYAVKHFGLPSIASLPCVVMLCASLLRLSSTRLGTELSVPHLCRAHISSTPMLLLFPTPTLPIMPSFLPPPLPPSLSFKIPASLPGGIPGWVKCMDPLECKLLEMREGWRLPAAGVELLQ